MIDNQHTRNNPPWLQILLTIITVAGTIGAAWISNRIGVNTGQEQAFATAAAAPAVTAVTQIAITQIAATPSDTFVLASSTFDKDDEQWTEVVKEGEAATNKPIYQSIGGNLGGAITSNDIGTGNSYLAAPEKFLGTKSSLYGGLLLFDLRTSAMMTNVFTAPLVILVSHGNRTTLVFDTLYLPQQNFWTTYAIPLSEATRWINRDTGQSATSEDMRRVLSSLSELEIRSEFVRGSKDTVSLDNVLLLRLP
jgi:hypothetical protein